MNLTPKETQIKPELKLEPQYRPYKQTKYEWLGKMVVSKNSGNSHTINRIGTNCVEFTSSIGSCYLDRLFKDFTWTDGTPFGELDQ